jgi:hypothetical protein
MNTFGGGGMADPYDTAERGHVYAASRNFGDSVSKNHVTAREPRKFPAPKTTANLRDLHGFGQLCGESPGPCN